MAAVHHPKSEVVKLSQPWIETIEMWYANHFERMQSVSH